MKDVTTTIASSNDTTETHPPINDHGVLLSNDTTTITLIAKFGKECIELTDLSPEITVGQVKEALFTRTRVLPIRQKLIGLVAGAGNRPVTDDVPLRDLKVKNTSGKNHYKDANKPIITHHCILMGTPEEEIFIDPHHRDDLPDVVDDFDLDFNAGSAEWYQHVANGENLKKFTEHTQIHIMHHPRPGMPLLVLDLDHTLLDFSSKILLTRHDADPGTMKRPHMDAFLTQCYQHYDLVVWSQTSWRWLETKLIELGMLTNAGYRFCFVLDKVRGLYGWSPWKVPCAHTHVYSITVPLLLVGFNGYHRHPCFRLFPPIAVMGLLECIT